MCRPLPQKPNVSPYSAAWVALQAQPGRAPEFAKLQVTFGPTRRGDSYDTSYPVYSDAGIASSVVHVVRCSGVAWSAYVCGRTKMEGARVRFPRGAFPEGNQDGHLSLEDDVAKREYDFWGASMPSDVPDSPFATLAAGQCPYDGDGTDCSGSTATNIATSLGAIDPRDIVAAEADPHGTLPSAIDAAALCASRTWVYPATSSDGGNTDATPACRGALGPNGRPPEGTRFFLDLSDADVNATSNAPYVKVVLRTLDREHFGGTITDTNWSGAPGLAFGFVRDGWSALANDRPWFQRGLPITTNGIDLTKSLRFCTNGTC